MRINVRGRFTDLHEVRGRVIRARGRKCETGAFEAQLADPAGVEKQTVSYGPYELEPSMGHGAHGGGEGGSPVGHNVIRGNQPKPCEDCWVIAMVPDLVDADGNSVNFSERAMLHHIVFSDTTEPDATCGNRRERFFASGNERSPFVIPNGYGYRIDAGDNWLTIAHLMNMGEHTRELSVEVTTT